MSENRKIAKNSLILYIRLVITTVVGLYTTRLVLLQLGASDYGLYAVVGGIISMLSFLNITMISSTYRFIAVEIGKKEKGDPNKVFNTSLVIHLVIAILLLLIGEFIGRWYIFNYLNIQPEKISDAIFVLRMTIMATFFTIISVPYQGLITANEKFFVRAGIEIIRAVIKLLLVLILVIYDGNKLRAYAIIMLIVMVLPPFLMYFYTRRYNEDIVKWRFNREESLYKEILSFSFWIMLGAGAHVGVRQGAALIVNLFFGTVINASFGIATQVYNFIAMFVNNLNQAAVPQIMKSYSSGDNSRSLSLVYSISKYSFYVMLIPTVVLLLNIDFILKLWLKDVPIYTKQFIVLMLINGLIGSSASGFNAMIQASGKIKKVQVWYSIFLLASLPMAYILFKKGLPPYFITVTMLLSTFFFRFLYVWLLEQITEFNTKDYIYITIIPAINVSLSVLPLFYFSRFFNQGIIEFILISLLAVTYVGGAIYILGLNKDEKDVILVNLRKFKLFN